MKNNLPFGGNIFIQHLLYNRVRRCRFSPSSAATNNTCHCWLIYPTTDSATIIWQNNLWDILLIHWLGLIYKTIKQIPFLAIKSLVDQRTLQPNTKFAGVFFQSPRHAWSDFITISFFCKNSFICLFTSWYKHTWLQRQQGSQQSRAPPPVGGQLLTGTLAAMIKQHVMWNVFTYLLTAITPLCRLWQSKPWPCLAL